MEHLIKTPEERQSFYLIIHALGTLIKYDFNDPQRLSKVAKENGEAFRHLIEELRKRNNFVHIYFLAATEDKEEELYNFLKTDLEIDDVPLIEFTPLEHADNLTEEAKRIATMLGTSNHLIIDSFFDFKTLTTIEDPDRYTGGFNYILCNPTKGLEADAIDEILKSIDDYSFKYDIPRKTYIS